MAFRVASSNLFQIPRLLYQSVRTRKRGPRPKKVYDELETNLYPGEYCLESHGMKYFPRDKTYKDPPYNPTKLLMIQRIKSLYGVPWFDIKILKQFGLAGPSRDPVAIVKNIPSINRDIWKVKYLVKVTPITFPFGEPTEDDINRTYLTKNGEFVVSDLAAVHPDRVEGQEKFRKDPLLLDGWTLKSDSRRRWQSSW